MCVYIYNYIYHLNLIYLFIIMIVLFILCKYNLIFTAVQLNNTTITLHNSESL